ncbi:ternary protein-Dna Complex1, partial [Fragilariopsis cylindrus CCMP1102]
WTKEEDDTLRNAVALEGGGRTIWKEISGKYFRKNRSGTQCKNRFNNHLQRGLIRGNWKPGEDRVVQRMVLEGFPWRDIAHQLPGRVGDSIRERYVNFLDPRLKKTPWTKEEDDILFQYQRIVGNKWSEIRKCIPGRSENSIKNRY